MALVVELVIGQFQFVETYNLTHPRLTGSRRIGMNVDARRDRRICVSRNHPLWAVVHVPLKNSENKFHTAAENVHKHRAARHKLTRYEFVFTAVVAWPSGPGGHAPKRASQKAEVNMSTKSWSAICGDGYFKMFIIIFAFWNTKCQTVSVIFSLKRLKQAQLVT